jgi:hypothetical protein
VEGENWVIVTYGTIPRGTSKNLAGLKPQRVMSGVGMGNKKYRKELALCMTNYGSRGTGIAEPLMSFLLADISSHAWGPGNLKTRTATCARYKGGQLTLTVRL